MTAASSVGSEPNNSMVYISKTWPTISFKYFYRNFLGSSINQKYKNSSEQRNDVTKKIIKILDFNEGLWQGEVFAISDCLVVIVCGAPFTFAESSSMALTIAPAGHDTTTMEEKWTCVDDICQICPEWYPLIGPGVPFPAPITGLWDFGYFGERLLPDKGCSWNKAYWVGG